MKSTLKQKGLQHPAFLFDCVILHDDTLVKAKSSQEDFGKILGILGTCVTITRSHNYDGAKLPGKMLPHGIFY